MTTPRSRPVASTAGLIPILLALLRTTSADDSSEPTLVADSDCDCFLTTGQETNYFANHQFFDFRSLSSFYSGIPPIPSAVAAARDAPESSDFFGSSYSSSSYSSPSSFNDAWEIQDWNNSATNPFGGAGYLLQNSPANVYVDLNGDTPDDSPRKSDTYLVLRTAKVEGFQSAGEFQSRNADYHFMSVRMLARVAGDPGACAAIFTYRQDGSVYTAQETDIEILTSGPEHVIQLTNQPSYTEDGKTVDESTLNATLPSAGDNNNDDDDDQDGDQDGGWRGWAEYRIDWSPGISTWYVDGELVGSLSFQAPVDPAAIILNAWGDGGEWTGVMQDGDSAYLEVQWIEVVFNRTQEDDDGDYEDRRRRRMGKRDVDDDYASRPRSPGGLSQGMLEHLGRFLKRDDDDDKSCARVCSVDATNVTGVPMLMYDSLAGPSFPRAGGGVGWYWAPTILVAVASLALSW